LSHPGPGGFENEIKVKGLWKWDQGQVALKMRSRSDDLENDIKVRWFGKWDLGQVALKMRSRSDDFENDIKVRWYVNCMFKSNIADFECLAHEKEN
jgi:hypothetical protein